MARKIPEHAVAEMLHSVGDANNIRNIIVVGGGAFFFKQAIKDAFPRHKIHELKDALYSPVRGFQDTTSGNAIDGTAHSRNIES